MLKVSDIMTTSVVTLTPEATIREAMEALSTNHLGGVPVVTGEHVSGVVSMTDILNFIVAAPQVDAHDEADAGDDRWSRENRDYDDVEDIDPATLSEDVWEEWPDNARPDEASADGANLFDQHTVAEVMTEEIFSVAPTSSIRNVATIMGKRGIHRVLVMEDRKLCGIVSALDIARVVSEKGVPGTSGVKPDPCCDEPSPWITV